MKWQELNNVVLVGHSYACMVISGVAEKMEKSLSSFVMLDAFFPETGQALVDLHPPPIRAQQPCHHGPLRCLMSTKKDRAWVDAQCTPYPIKCFLQKLTL